jgi:hypothetical protein
MQAVAFDMTKGLVALACGVVRLLFTGCRLPGRLFGGFSFRLASHPSPVFCRGPLVAVSSPALARVGRMLTACG